MNDKLLTVEELAELLNCKKSFIYRLNYERRGPKIIKLGSQMVRYRLSDVQTWLEQQALDNKEHV